MLLDGDPLVDAALQEHHDLDELAARNVLGYLDEEREVTGALPTDRTIVVQRFRDEIGDWSWWLVTDDLTPGSMFRLQLLPDLVSDVFLNGTLRGTSESVSTGAGSWTDAVVVDYVVELGTGSIVDEGGNTSHVAILARSLGVPAIVGLGGRAVALRDGAEVALDGTDGLLVVEPDAETTERFHLLTRQQVRVHQKLEHLRDLPALALDNKAILVADHCYGCTAGQGSGCGGALQDGI